MNSANLRLKLTKHRQQHGGAERKNPEASAKCGAGCPNYVDGVKKRIEQDRAKVTAAEADVKKWMEERKASTDANIAEWKTKREVAHLKSRADNAETYAAAAAVIALASVDEAEQAALEAWLARKDVESVQTAKAA
jgi:hypothetical protein